MFEVIYGIVSFLFALGLGLGVTFFVLGTVLEKSNNIGDSRGTSDDYKAFIHFTTRKDEISYEEKKTFSSEYAVKVYDPSSEPDSGDTVRRLSDEEVARSKGITAEEAAALREDQLENLIKDHVAKQSIFGKNKSDLKGVFGPLKDK